MITKLTVCDHFEMYRNTEFQRIPRKGKKGFLSEQCKEIEENNRTGKTRDLFKKIRETKSIPKKKKCKKKKWLSEEGLQISEEKKK